MAYPPSGYSLQDGGYFTADGQGPYAWDGTVMVLRGSLGDTALTQHVPFSGAGTDVLHWIGPGRLMQVVQEASAVGSLLIKDQMAAGLGPTVANLTTTGTPQTFLLNSGAGAAFYGGLTLTTVGAGNSGYLVIGEV